MAKYNVTSLFEKCIKLKFFFINTTQLIQFNLQFHSLKIIKNKRINTY